MFQRKRTTRAIKLLACAGFLFFVSLSYAFSTGPLPGFSGAPGESNCTECHDSFGEETNTGSGFVAITHPPRYEASQRLTITVAVGQPGQNRWGFQITALTTDTNEPVGQFVITDSVHTQLIQGENGRWYVEHTEEGTFARTPVGAEWSFDWIAPETDVGPVVFYAAGNAANNDGERLGDWIYTTLSPISPPSYPAATVLAPNGNEVLGVGEAFTIQWDATANAATFDLLFFPFPGALPETIASSLPSDARSYEWTVPDLVTDSARIAVLTFNDAGFGIDESERAFLIVHKSPSLVQVLEPSGSPVVKGGEHLMITWTVGDSMKITGQQIRLSVDGGKTFPLVLARSLPVNARSFDWLVPTDLKTQSARVLVLVRAADGNLAADANDADFVISNP
jgi:hypothetical protein